MTHLPQTLIGDFIDAAVDDHTKAASMLAEHPELIDARWIHDETVLHFLTVEGFTEGVRCLLKHGADVESPNKFGDSPLVDAAVLGKTEMAALRLQHGARPDGSRFSLQVLDQRATAVHSTAFPSRIVRRLMR